jgi:arabinosaccharide transport system substrate-binding protein
MTPARRNLASDGSPLSLGAWLVVALAVLSSLLVAVSRPRPSETRTMWLFAKPHMDAYAPIVADWNAAHEPRVTMRLLSRVALDRRLMSSFLSGTPAADLIEAERQNAARAFTGPLEAVGFVDLTDRLESEGLRSRINAPSFGPWSSRGRIFGLPHDVHPVMLGYRADIVEAAGIDVAEIRTWDDFERLLRPLMDTNSDGKPDRFLLNLWETSTDHIEILLLQAGGGFFDESGAVAINTPVNARVLARIVRWCQGPSRIAADAPNFMASGNQLKAEGYVLSSFFPDWMCDVWKHELPQLSGKIKLMPLPAWDEGARRTSVWGGTMLGIPRSAVRTPADFEPLWEFAKHLYLSKDLATKLYRSSGIVTPVREFWSDPVYDEPDPYFSGQAKGRAYIQLAPDVPARTSNPYNSVAQTRVQDALVQLSEETRSTNNYDEAHLRERAAHFLARAHEIVRGQIERNVFLSESGGRP